MKKLIACRLNQQLTYSVLLYIELKLVFLWNKFCCYSDIIVFSWSPYTMNFKRTDQYKMYQKFMKK